MIPTIQAVKDKARALLGDAEVTGGQVFTDAILQPYCETAFADLYRVLDLFNIQFVERNLYYVLPANQTAFYPRQAGHNNFGEPVAVRIREPTETVAISNVAVDLVNPWCLVTTAANTFSTGDTVIIYNVQLVSFDVNDEWTIEVVNSTTIKLLGCRATGAYTDGGQDFASKSTHNWSDPLRFLDSPADVHKLGVDGVDAVAWERDRFIFNRSTIDRQIMIEYSLSGALGTTDTDSVGIDDSLDYMAYRAASLAAEPFGAQDLASRYERQSIGSVEALSANEPGGFLGNMVRRGVQALQKESFETQRFRPRRNTGRSTAFH